MQKIPDAVQWHEGLQLLPQHFQLQDLRAETLAAVLAASAHPWYWGIEHYEIDSSSLLGGRIRLLSLSAILPDGLPVMFDAGCDPAVELNVTKQLDQAHGKDLLVSLAVTPLQRGGQWLPLKGRLHSMVGPAIPDLASGEFPEPIPVWRPALRLVVEATRKDSVYLPLLKIGRDGKAYVRRPYLPPTPLLLPETELGKRIAALCVQAREKCQFLANRLRQARQSADFEDIQEIRSQLAAVWSGVPVVEAVLGSRIAHPAQVHRELVAMAGALIALDPVAGLPVFRPLRYQDLLAGFDEVLTWLEAALASIRGGYRSIPFKQAEQVFSLELPNRQAARQELIVGLRMPLGATPAAARDWLDRCVLGSAGFIETLRRQRMRGLAFKPMEQREQIAYSVGEDTRLFVLYAQGEWFRPEEPLQVAAFHDQALVAPREIVLFQANATS